MQTQTIAERIETKVSCCDLEKGNKDPYSRAEKMRTRGTPNRVLMTQEANLPVLTVNTIQSFTNICNVEWLIQ